MLRKTVVLVGLMGAGKTSVGLRLADKLGVNFYDSDAEIERIEGKTVSEIFNENGEPYFRKREAQVIDYHLSLEPQVLATGGGSFMLEKTRELILNKAYSVWLKAELPVLLERVSRKDSRPLLKNVDKEVMLKKLMEERYPIYEMADITVHSTDSPHETVVEEIVNILKSKSWI